MLTPARRSARRRKASGALAALVVAASAAVIAGVGATAPAAYAAPANPTIDCSTDAAIFNTGVNPSTAGILANGVADNNWQVSTTDLTTMFPAGVQPPASSVTFASALVGNPVPRQQWPASPSSRANWITERYVATPSGQGAGNTWYYRYDFTLDPAVEPSLFSVRLMLLSDNAASEIWVNGIAQSPDNASLPQGGSSNPYNPYRYRGFAVANAIDVTLADGWETGANSIVVQVLSDVPWQGFLAWATAAITCGPNAIDDTLSAIGQNESITPFSPVGNDIEGTSPLVASTVALDQSTSVGGSFSVNGAGLVSFTAAPGFVGLASIDYDVNDLAGLTGRATITIPVTAVAPTASPDIGMTDPEVPIDVDVLANDVPGNAATPLDAGSVVLDARSSGGTVSSAGTTLTVPGEGTYSVLPGGSVRFVPVPTFRGAVASEVGYTVADADGTQTSSTLLITVSDPALALDKALTDNDDADVSTTVTEGDTLTYEIVATNTGDVTLTDVVVTDELTQDTVLCSVVGSGSTCTLTVTYTVTEADAVLGQVVNTAIGSGAPPSGPRIDAPSATVRTLVDANQQLPTLSNTGVASSLGAAVWAAAGALLLGAALMASAWVRRRRNLDLMH